MVTTLYGWTYEQFQKASEYFNLCNHSQVAAQDIFLKAALSDKQAIDELLNVMTYWKSRRIDAPGESKILTLDVPYWPSS